MSLRARINQFLLAVALILNGLLSFAQDTGLKGNVTIFWGWNREWYTNSDIRFNGDYYDFTLQDVEATDRQDPFTLDNYLNPAHLTVPQTNFKAGYFIRDHYCITAGFDHMKYVMVQDQTVKIDGVIHDEDSPYNGVYNNEDIVLSNSFLEYEHTDGLNFIHAGLDRYDRLANIHALRTSLYLTEGFSAGIVMPRTAVRFMNHELSDYFHISGYGLSLEAGLSILIFKVITIRSEFKGGFIHLPDVKTSNSNVDKAHQHFFYLQSNLLFGVTIPLLASH